MLRSWPHLEDDGGIAGGDSTALRTGSARPKAMLAGNFPPPGEDRVTPGSKGKRPMIPDDQLENQASAKTDESITGDIDDDEDEDDLPDFLNLVRSAEDQALMYIAQTNRRGWSQSMRAFHQEHFVGSKYTKKDWYNRSKIFRPKTRSSVRKDMAAVAASLFNNIDAINCLPGDEGDPKQRAAAGIMEQLVNYRTDRSSGRAAIPWFLVALGSRQNSLLTGVCLSKQSWKLELRKLDDEEKATDTDEDGSEIEVSREVWVPDIDRPDCQLIPPENFVIDPAADWTNPAQSAAYLFIKWPMHVDEIIEKQNSPQNPWKVVEESVLLSAVEAGKMDTAAIRRSRESGIDRFDETQTGNQFRIVWVYEVFMRWQGEDYTFFSVGSQEYLTDPRPVREVYPEQFGERPLTLGYGSLEAHRIFPMSPVESWQQYQVELNDMANLTLDAIKQNVMPVTKVRRGRNIDLDQVKRRSYGSSIIVQEPDDLTFERPPDIPQSVPQMTRELELEFDDLAGQFNGQTAENSNALSRTLGGLKLVSGSANAVQEYDIRVWIETWVAPTLEQIVRLEQYYESDPIVLGICGNRANMFQKHGVSQIDDDLLEQDITVRVSVGLGAGDPQQRLMKFQSAVQIAMPVLQGSPQFTSGEWQIDAEAVMEEVFGAAGYRDGGMRFIKKGPPKPNPLGDLPAQKLQSEITKNINMGKGALLTGLSKVAQVNLGDKELEAQKTNDLLGAQIEAHKMGFEHGHRHMDQHLAATDKGFQHGLGLREHHLKATDQAHRHEQERTAQAADLQQQAHQQEQDKTQQAMDQAAQQAGGSDDTGGGASGAPDQGAPTQGQQPDQSADTSGAPPAQPMAPPGPPGLGTEVPLPGATQQQASPQKAALAGQLAQLLQAAQQVLAQIEKSP
jgi:hypothetical protein